MEGKKSPPPLFLPLFPRSAFWLERKRSVFVISPFSPLPRFRYKGELVVKQNIDVILCLPLFLSRTFSPPSSRKRKRSDG